MVSKLFAGLMVTAAVTVSGLAWGGSSASQSCCAPGADCCYPGSPCCAADNVKTDTPAQ